jgi:hypothetical protein
MESLADGCPSTRALLHSSIKVPVIRAPPHIPGSPRMERSPPWREIPVSGDFLNIYSRVSSEGSPPEGPPTSLFKERSPIPRAPCIQLSESPLDEPSSRFSKWGPYGKRHPSPEPFLHILQGPQQASPPSRFPSQSSHRKRHSTSRAPFNHISKPPVDELTPGCPTEPP